MKKYNNDEILGDIANNIARHVNRPIRNYVRVIDPD